MIDGATSVARAPDDRRRDVGARVIPVAVVALTVLRAEAVPGMAKGAMVVLPGRSVGPRPRATREIVPAPNRAVLLATSVAGNVMTEPPAETASSGGRGRGIDPRRRSAPPETRVLSLRYPRTSLARNWTGPCGARCAL